MDQNVFGIVYCSGQEAEGETHEHTILLATWDGRAVHVHNFAGTTSIDVHHAHRYAGKTAPAISGRPHTHRYVTITSVDDGHQHKIEGVTGPVVPLPGGGHYHLFHGVTTVNGRTPHRHTYSGRTGGEV